MALRNYSDGLRGQNKFQMGTSWNLRKPTAQKLASLDENIRGAMVIPNEI